MKKIIHVLFAIALCFLSTPTASAMGWLTKPSGVTYTPFTNYVPVVITVTNPVTGVATPVTITNTQIVDRWFTNYAANPAITNAINLGHEATAFIPAPYGDLAALGLTGLSALLGLLVRARNGQLSTANSIVGAVVAGVEAAGDSTTKASIQSHAAAAGVQTELHSIVQATTQAPSPGAIIPPTAATPKV